MIQQLLLVGQLIIVASIYLFIWRVVSFARRDIRSGASAVARQPGQHDASADASTIIPAADVAKARRAAGIHEPRLVVEASDVLRAGIPFVVGKGLTIGRTDVNDIALDESWVSSNHVKIVPPGTVIDQGATNGSLINGVKMPQRQALRPGDRLQIGSTVFLYEGG